MILNLYNSTSEIIKVYFYNCNQKLIIDAFQKQTFTVNDEIIQFEVSSNTKSKYAKLFKRTEFQVLSKYSLLNKYDIVDITFEKEVAEDSTYNKFIGFVCKDCDLFTKIEYGVVDSEAIKKKDRKNTLLYYFMLFLSHFFSKVNMMYAAIGMAIGYYFEIKYGIMCYLLIFTLYIIIICFIDLHNDKHLLSVDRLMTHDYISALYNTGDE